MCVLIIELRNVFITVESILLLRTMYTLVNII